MSSGTYTLSSLCISTGTPSPLFQTLMVSVACSNSSAFSRCSAFKRRGQAGQHDT